MKLLTATLCLLISISCSRVKGVSYVQVKDTTPVNKKILAGAKKEVENRTKYNKKMLEKYHAPVYKNGICHKLPHYPGGDVHPKQGICADLVVRSLRYAGQDLQMILHQDIIANSNYYRVKKPDKYADHRRTWILLKFFKKNARTVYLPGSKKYSTMPVKWMPGDIVIWDTGSDDHLHIGIMADRVNRHGIPLVIHNMLFAPFLFKGRTAYQDALYGPRLARAFNRDWEILGIFRVRG